MRVRSYARGVLWVRSGAVLGAALCESGPIARHDCEGRHESPCAMSGYDEGVRGCRVSEGASAPGS